MFPFLRISRLASVVMILAAIALVMAGWSLAHHTQLFYTSCAAALIALFALGLALKIK